MENKKRKGVYIGNNIGTIQHSYKIERYIYRKTHKTWIQKNERWSR